jgi:DNA-binding transcriptional MerR regulator
MLRHYDAIGLLKPAFVDQVTGYRSYEARQLSRLNRIVALKGLGFTLQQVRSVLDDEVSVEELRGMLRLRHAELQSQIETDTARLAQVEARLQIIEREGTMPADEVQIKRIPGLRVAELTGTAAGFEPESIAPVIGPLYDELRDRERKRLQREVIALIRARSAQKSLPEHIANWDRNREPGFAAALDTWREQYFGFLSDFDRTLTAEQRARVLATLRRYTEELEALAAR